IPPPVHQLLLPLERARADGQQVLPAVRDRVVAEDDRTEAAAQARVTSVSTARRAASTVSTRPKSAPSAPAASESKRSSASAPNSARDLNDRGSRSASASNAASRHAVEDRKSTRLNSSHRTISYAVFCLKKKKQRTIIFN